MRPNGLLNHCVRNRASACLAEYQRFCCSTANIYRPKIRGSKILPKPATASFQALMTLTSYYQRQLQRELPSPLPHDRARPTLEGVAATAVSLQIRHALSRFALARAGSRSDSLTQEIPG